MRWIFIFLVFLNLFFYIWQRQQVTAISSDNQSITSSVDTNIPTIKLLKEQPVAKKTTAPTENNITQQTPSENTTDHTEQTAEPLTCLYLGGLTNQDQLDVINEYLIKIDNSLDLTVIKLTESPKFALYIPINNISEQTTILDKLNTASINTLIIPRGLLENNISLGLFADKTTYHVLEEKLKTLDIPLAVENLPESANSYWLKIPHSKRSLFTSALLKSLIEEFPTVQQELMPCQLALKNSD